MRSEYELRDIMNSDHYKELQILNEIEGSSDVTQRQLSQRAGIALGLTNALLRNLIKKGYLRSQQASWKRWVYSLTPEGVSHKIRLTIDYIKRFLNQYQKIRQTLRAQLEPLALHEESRVALVGTGEFAELVYLGLKDLGIQEIEIFSNEIDGDRRFLGMDIKDIGSLEPALCDYILLASLTEMPDESLLNSLKHKEDLGKLVTFFSSPNKGVV